MNGKLIPYTPLAVDFWRVAKFPEARIFFLSHMHADHTSGLTPTWSRPIYCSPITAVLLKHKFNIADKFIRPLELGESHCVPLDGVGTETMTVTLIDANHCPGAVMFLFQGYFGNILYTGDFRFIPEMLKLPLLQTNIIIDVLYLDNTYCPSKWHFPSREDATEEIKIIIRNHPDHQVVIGIYSLGKESLLVELAMEFGWLGVSPERMKTLQLLGLPNVFTTAIEECRLRVVDAHQLNSRSVAHWNCEWPTIAVLPSGNRAGRQPCDSIFIVPYSDHSSYGELRQFVAGLQPRAIVPINKGPSCEGYFREFLSTTQSSQSGTITIPESVQRFMREGGVSACSNNCLPKRRARIFRTSRTHIPKGVCFDSPKSSIAKHSPPLVIISSSEDDDEAGDYDSMRVVKNEDDKSFTLPSESIAIQLSFDNAKISDSKSTKVIMDTKSFYKSTVEASVHSHADKSIVKRKLDYAESLSSESFTKHVTCVEDKCSFDSLPSPSRRPYDGKGDRQGAPSEARVLTNSPKSADGPCLVGALSCKREDHPVDFHTPLMGGRHSVILKRKVQSCSQTQAGKCYLILSPLHAFLSEKEKRLRFNRLVEKCMQQRK